MTGESRRSLGSLPVSPWQRWLQSAQLHSEACSGTCPVLRHTHGCAMDTELRPGLACMGGCTRRGDRTRASNAASVELAAFAALPAHHSAEAQLLATLHHLGHAADLRSRPGRQQGQGRSRSQDCRSRGGHEKSAQPRLPSLHLLACLPARRAPGSDRPARTAAPHPPLQCMRAGACRQQVSGPWCEPCGAAAAAPWHSPRPTTRQTAMQPAQSCTFHPQGSPAKAARATTDWRAAARSSAF